MLLNVGRYSPRLRSSYIEISNYFRGRQTVLRTGLLSSQSPQHRQFHRQSCLREQPHIFEERRPFLERYKNAGMDILATQCV